MLVVEDEALVALDLEMTVQAEGAEVVGPVGRLPAARRLAEGEALDLAILDIMVGTDEVFPLARDLAARGVPFVFHSGHADPKSLEGEFPWALHCPKPCSPRTIVKALERLAAGRGDAEG